MTLGEIIKQYRLDHKMSMDALAEKSGVSKSYISLLEKNKHPHTGKPIVPSIQIIKQFSKAMNIDFNELFSKLDGDINISTKEKEFKNSLSKKSGTKIPVLGRVAAGIPLEAIEDIIDYEEIPEELAKTGEFFGLKIKGDSMEPRIREGDVVIVRKQDDAETGDVVVAMINGDDATCKRLKKYGEGIMLISNNPAYEPFIFNYDEIREKPVRIVGKVIELRGKL